MTTTRKAEVRRETGETRVKVALDLDGVGAASIATGIGFLDHMLDLLARHSLIDLTVEAKGDLHVDKHHTTEDVGIVLGQALSTALGDRRGITRYASIDLPMDETLTRVAIDVSGRPMLVWRVAFPAPSVGGMECELFREWFQAFSQNAGITVHIETFYGDSAHHVAESCFKALARALRLALSVDAREADRIPSTKGSLTA